MSVSQPPVSATRLMQRAGIDPAIIGDLIEECSNGRSRVWYWRQAVGALSMKSSPRSRFIVLFRWSATLPLAILAVRLVSRCVMVFVRDVPQARLWIPISFFLMAAAFLSTGVAVAPDRKDAVARIALGVVLLCSAAFMAMSFFTGEKLSTVPLTWGACSLLGGLAAHRFQRNLRKT
jgi:hypothetical protein